MCFTWYTCTIKNTTVYVRNHIIIIYTFYIYDLDKTKKEYHHITTYIHGLLNECVLLLFVTMLNIFIGCIAENITVYSYLMWFILNFYEEKTIKYHQ